MGPISVLSVRSRDANSVKLGRTHQNVLVFVKGDPKRATEACGPVEFGEIEAAEDEGNRQVEE